MTTCNRIFFTRLAFHIGILSLLLLHCTLSVQATTLTAATSRQAVVRDRFAGEVEHVEVARVERQSDAHAASLLAPDQQYKAVLVRTIDTSQFVPPSTDPTGISFLASEGKLIISDSEVDETVHFSGTNIFVVDIASGVLVGRWNTLAFSEEPTGVAINSDNNHLFITDDNAIKMSAAAGPHVVHPGPEITEVDAGPDGLYFTDDDVISIVPTAPFGGSDPEGIAYDPVQKHLLLLDDTSQQIFEISPGANGVFDGVLPDGDDHVTAYDVSLLGMKQLKGITYNPANAHLYLVGEPDSRIFETTLTGRLVRTINTSVMSATAPSDLVFAPSSVDPSTLNLYVTDRGVDNNNDPMENDGKIYEISLSVVEPSNDTAPVVDAGVDFTVAASTNPIPLNGSVIDDGLPDPPGNVQVRWSQLAGPSKVVFSDPTQIDTAVVISEVGVYVLRLRADDGESVSDDLITITAEPAGTVVNLPPTVNAGPDRIANVGQIITLTGNVSDDGLPDPPAAVIITWTFVSGPTTATVASPGALVTQVGPLEEQGQYVFRLTANDGEYEVFNDVRVGVIVPGPVSNPEPNPDPDPEPNPDPDPDPDPEPNPNPDPDPDPDPDPNPDPDPDPGTGGDTEDVNIYLPYTSKD